MFWWGKKRDEDEGPRAAPAPARSGPKRQKEKLVEAKFPLPPKREPFKPGQLDIEDKRVYDYVRFHTAENVWYYRDRMSVPRGPCSLPVLREAWVHGVIDENTMVWGQGLADWLPIRNVRTLTAQIRTVEVQVGAFVKKHLALKPALARVRKARAEQRPEQSLQVSNMY